MRARPRPRPVSSGGAAEGAGCPPSPAVLPYETRSFWTARQRAGHSLHEISYRACFKPQLPEYFIERLTAPGDVVLDPFMGRGTTAIQAALMGRRAYASDINPLCPMLARPRLRPPVLEAVRRRLAEMPADAPVARADEPLLAFFHPATLRRLVAMKTWFAERARRRALDQTDEWIRMVALNRLTGHSPGFFSVRTMPPNQAVSVEKQKRLNAQNGQAPVPKDVPALILKKSASLLRSGNGGLRVGHRIRRCPADRLRYVPDAGADLVVTSPPFLDIVDYKGDNWLRCWFAGIDAAQLPLSRHGKLDDWGAFVRRCFAEFARVVKPGGHVAFEVGEVRNGSVLLEERVVEAARGLPFDLEKVMVNQQQFTKTSNCWGVANNEKGVTTNRVVLLRRTGAGALWGAARRATADAA